MFCPNCGTKNQDDSLFCENCGTALPQNQVQETPEGMSELSQQPVEGPFISQPEQSVPVQPDQTQFTDQPEQPEQTQFTDQSVQPEQTQFTGQPEQPEQTQFTDQSVQPEQTQFTGQPEQPEQTQFTGQSEQPEQTQFTGQSVQPEQTQFTGQSVQPEQTQFTGQPVQPQYTQFAGQQPQGYVSQPTAPKKPLNFKITKKMITIGAAVLVALIAVVTFIVVGNTGSDYKKTAKKYVQAILKCDWNAAYDMVNFPDSEFLTKEAFKEVNADATPKEISQIVVTDSDIYSSLGLSTSAALGKEVTVMYSTPGSSQSTMDLMMDLSPEKYMLFFKQYKVSSDSIVSSDIVLKVPAGSKLFVNGVEVNSSYLTTSNRTSKTQDSYKIPYLFDGNNTLKVTGDLFEDYETDFTVYYDDDSYSVSPSNLTMKEEIMTAVKAQAETDLKMIADACVANKDVSAIASRVLSSDSSKVTQNYNSSLRDCHSTSRNVQSMALSNIKTSINSKTFSIDSEDGYPTVQVTLGYTKTGTYTYNSSGDSVREGTGTETSDYIRYKYLDGTWMISYISIDLYIS